MKKYILDFRVVENTKLHHNYALLKLKPDNNEPLPDMLPGQFVEVRVDRSPGTYLRRPISFNFVDSTRNELWLLIRKAGEGTRTLCDLKQGDSINLVLPFGNTFSFPDETDSILLLIGGGVGIAPMLYWGKYLKERNYTPKFLLGFRSDKDILQYEMFRQFGDVYISTEDGSVGTKGNVMDAIREQHLDADMIFACGPTPMLRAIKTYAEEKGIECNISLEERMACGIGACLACVCKTKEKDAHSNVNNKRICKDGPVFLSTEVDL